MKTYSGTYILHLAKKVTGPRWEVQKIYVCIHVCMYCMHSIFTILHHCKGVSVFEMELCPGPLHTLHLQTGHTLKGKPGEMKIGELK